MTLSLSKFMLLVRNGMLKIDSTVFKAIFAFSCVAVGTFIAWCSQPGTLYGTFSYSGMFCAMFTILAVCSFQPVIVLARAVTTQNRWLVFGLSFTVLVVFSLMFAITDLFGLIVFMQVVAIISYVLVMVANRVQRNWVWVEALLKYILISSFAGVLGLSGTAVIYATYGTGNYYEILYLNTVFSFDHAVTKLGFLLLLTAFLVKSGFAPFHSWLVEVYDGLPAGLVTFFAVVLKLGYLFTLIRVALLNPFLEIKQYLLVVVVCSLLVGAVGAGYQTKFKRFMVYSGVSHSGWVGLGLFGFYTETLTTSFIYVFFYGLLVGAIFQYVLQHGSGVLRTPVFLTDLEYCFASFGRFNLLCFAILIFSAAGIPPLLGFFVKYSYISCLVDTGAVWLVICLILTSLLSAYNYLRFIRVFFVFGNLVNHGSLSKVTALTWVAAINFYWIFYHKLVYEYIFYLVTQTTW